MPTMLNTIVRRFLAMHFIHIIHGRALPTGNRGGWPMARTINNPNCERTSLRAADQYVTLVHVAGFAVFGAEIFDRFLKEQGRHQASTQQAIKRDNRLPARRRDAGGAAFEDGLRQK